MKLCPGCSNLIPTEARRCECGFAFPERKSTSVPHPSASSDATGKRKVFWWLSIYMIVTFLWRAFVPGGEYPRAPTRFMTMAIDLLCVGILIGLKVQLSAAKKPGKPASTGGTVLFCIALVAGLGVLAIRLHGDGSWATGHFFQEELRPYPYR